MPIKRKLWGLRGKLPPGVMIGRRDPGDGDAQLLTYAEIKAADMLNITDGLLHPQVMSRICIGS